MGETRGQRILTDEQIDRMARMRERGLSYSSIADWFTRNGTPIKPLSIRWQCLRHGAFPPGQQTRNVGRGHWGVGKPFTPEEDERLLALEQKGVNPNAIGRAIGRSRNSVVNRMLTLAYRDTDYYKLACAPSSNGRTPPFEGGNLGSSPSGASR